MYQLQTRLLDILNLPLAERIQQLKFCIETGPIKDLQVIFKRKKLKIFNDNKVFLYFYRHSILH